MASGSSDQRLTDRIFEALKAEIITCKLKPGEIFNELEAARRFNTSRTPIREACNRLTRENLLVSVPNKGHFVSPITIRDILDHYQLRFIVETAAAELAAERLTPQELKQLRRLLELERGPKSKDRKENRTAFIEMNRRFHLGIAEATRNRRVVELVEALLLESARLDYFLMDIYPEAWTDHREIFAALKARDGSRARAAMARHIQLTQERMSKVFSSEVFPSPA